MTKEQKLYCCNEVRGGQSSSKNDEERNVFANKVENTSVGAQIAKNTYVGPNVIEKMIGVCGEGTQIAGSKRGVGSKQFRVAFLARMETVQL